MSARYLVGDAYERMAAMPDGSVDLVMTSPPFLALRSYLPDGHPDKAKELGSKATPAEFIDTLLRLTAEWRRLLTPHGSICVELGDTYCGAGGYGSPDSPNPAYGDGERFAERWEGRAVKRFKRKDDGWPLAKSLAGIPAAYELSLAYGHNVLDRRGADSPAGMWRVRNQVAWVRPNPPVGALGDKFRPATSYLTVATVARDRWFDLDAVRQPSRDTKPRTTNGPKALGHDDPEHMRKHYDTRTTNPAGAPPLDWWEIPPSGYSGSHYAVYPPELCVRPIEAMCPRRVCRTCGAPSRRITSSQYIGRDGKPAPATLHMRAGERRAEGVNQWDEGATGDRTAHTVTTTTGWTACGCPGTDGIRLDGFHTGPGWRPGHVLDPFGGSGTTALVATDRGRDCTLIDIDERNAWLARERLGFFLTEVDLGIAMHGFGVKTLGLASYARMLASADSMAWSYRARRAAPLAGCEHRSCANCPRWAMRWREAVLARVADQQPTLFDLGIDAIKESTPA